jgi:hypothetical protein
VAADRRSPEQEVRRLLEEQESRAAKAAERMVSRDSFGELLAMATENVVALTRIGFDTMDMVWSNLRIAGRRDVARLARQIGRTEDKLELVLQELERLRDAETRTRPDAPSAVDGANTANRRPTRRSSKT